MKLSEIKINMEDLAKFCAERDRNIIEYRSVHPGKDLFEALYLDLFEHELSERDKKIFE
jgi:hypothetical protein